MGQRMSREEPYHRALHSRYSTTLVITNCTTYTVSSVWNNYQGEKITYFTLEPGASYHQPTFLTHPWTFKAIDTKPGQAPVLVALGSRPQAIFYPNRPGEEHVDIIEANQVDWSEGTHIWFAGHEHFHPLVQAVLLCFKRLQEHGPATLNNALQDLQHENTASTGLDCLPEELLHTIFKLAAPTVYEVFKPKLPEGLGESDMEEKDKNALFALK